MMNTIGKPVAVAVVGLGTLLFLAACGGDSGHDGMPSMTASSTLSASSGSAQNAQAADANAADVMFATMMIPHHAQAIDMAAMAATRAGSGEVKDLARKIQEAQQPEIDRMTSWLKAWGKPVPDASMSGMGHGGMDQGDGMMTEAEMQQLTAAKGVAFDRLFATLMIKHHEGAVSMAQQEAQNGKNPDAVALAKQIVKDQTAEIATLKGLLAT